MTVPAGQRRGPSITDRRRNIKYVIFVDETKRKQNEETHCKKGLLVVSFHHFLLTSKHDHLPDILPSGCSCAWLLTPHAHKVARDTESDNKGPHQQRASKAECSARIMTARVRAGFVESRTRYKRGTSARERKQGNFSPPGNEATCSSIS